MSRVEIEAGASGLHKVVLDGHDIGDAVDGLSLDVYRGRPLRVTLTLNIREFATASGDVRVGLTAGAERALKAAGWTPPSGDGGGSDG